MKARKIIRNILIGLVVVLVVLIAVAAIIYPPTEKYVPRSEHPYYNWMTDYIKGSTLLRDVVIPGAHDAGAADLDGSMFGLGRYLLVCQNASVGDQLKQGIRYFDLRTRLKGDELYIQHADFVCQKFFSVVEDIADYLRNGRDMLILNLQHFTDDETAIATFDYLEDHIEGFADLCLTKDECDFSTLTLDSIREKGKRLLIIWGSSIKPDENILFEKGSEGVGGATLYSPYDGAIHKKGDEALLGHLDYYIENSRNYSGLFNLQCQRTWAPAEPLMGPEQLEKRFTELADEYLLNLTDEQLECINIIHRDFVTTGDKIKIILSLNDRKGNTLNESLKFILNP